MSELEDWIHDELRKGKHHLRVVEDLVEVGHDHKEVHKLVLEVYSARKQRKIITVGVLSMVVFLSVVLFLVVSTSSPSSEFVSTPSEEVVSSGWTDYESVTREFDVRVSSSGMSPDVIRVGFMDDVVLRLRSVDGLEHRLISGFGMNVSVSSVESEFSFKANDLGFVYVRDGQGRPIGTIEVLSSLNSSN